MARVLLVVTGKMEAQVLHTSLARIFPDHEFHVAPRIDGFTSTPLPPPPTPLSQRHRTRLASFAASLVGRVRGARKDAVVHADFVIGLDDLELCNAAQPANVTAALRGAIADALASCEGASQARLTAQLQERCSFHLLAPMTEAYFFADAVALARATAPGPHRVNRFDPGACDVEQFCVSDVDYESAATVAKSARGPNDWRCEGRERHPKHYLEYLTDPALEGRGRYDETRQGCAALRELDWPALATDVGSPAVARFARSLIADLVDMLGAPAEHPALARLEHADCHPLTWPPPREPLLRNL